MTPRLVWGLTVGAAAATMGLAAAADMELPGSLNALFWYTLVITTACAAGAIALVALARRNDLAELGVLGAGLFAVSVLPMVHGLTLPGVLYGPNPVTMFSVLVGLPAGLIVTAPLSGGHRGLRDLVLRRWKGYTTASVGATLAVATAMLAAPGIWPLPGPRVPWAMILAGFGFAGALAVGRRHVDLYAVGRRPASLFAGIGWSFVGVASLVWFADEQLGLAVWTAHLLDGIGVLLAAGGLYLAHNRDRGLVEVFAPVINRDPIVALRLGVTPQVDEFLASLRDKDAQTRGHVIRVAELAMTLGIRAGFRADRLRTLGLAALMHDIGKLRVDHAILTKNGPLTDAEYDEIKLHTVIGEQMLSGDAMLRPASRLVRSHHERVDGTGYPDGLRGSEVGLDIGIIAVADAWDAMVQTRHYRAGMSEADARRILIDGAGIQWPAAAVELLLAELDDGWELRGVFAGVGWSDAGQVVCADTLVGLV